MIAAVAIVGSMSSLGLAAFTLTVPGQAAATTTSGATAPKTAPITVSGYGWVGKCLFDPSPQVLPGTKPLCAQFGINVKRSDTGHVTGSANVLCDRLLFPVRFRSTAIADLVVVGNTATIQASGRVGAAPTVAPATATITLTDNGGPGDVFAVTVRSGRAGHLVVCSARNVARGGISVPSTPAT